MSNPADPCPAARIRLSKRLRLCVSASFLLLFLGQIGPGLTAQDDEVISVESALVVLNAVVTDRTGRPVLGLERSRFRLSEDGTAQTLEVFETQEAPFAAVILMDVSGSMQARMTLARSAAITFLDGLRLGDSAAIYTFASKIELLQDFSGSRDVADRIFDVEPDGMTVLNDAIAKASEELAKRDERRRAIIVLSDGADTMSGRSRETALKMALAANATIYTVDMSDDTMSQRERMMSRGALRDFAEKTGGLFVATPGGMALKEAFRSIVRELGIQYTLGYQPTNARRDGRWRSIRLEVDIDGAKVRTRKGYNAARVR